MKSLFSKTDFGRLPVVFSTGISFLLFCIPSADPLGASGGTLGSVQRKQVCAFRSTRAICYEIYWGLLSVLAAVSRVSRSCFRNSGAFEIHFAAVDLAGPATQPVYTRLWQFPGTESSSIFDQTGLLKTVLHKSCKCLFSLGQESASLLHLAAVNPALTT
jgi:hypothetical protein